MPRKDDDAAQSARIRMGQAGEHLLAGRHRHEEIEHDGAELLRPEAPERLRAVRHRDHCQTEAAEERHQQEARRRVVIGDKNVREWHQASVRGNIWPAIQIRNRADSD